MPASMKVEAGSVVTLTYDILDEAGEIIESSDLSGPVSFLVGKGAIIKGLDKQVTGMEKGQEKSFDLPPEEAFGRPEDAPTRDVPRTDFPKEAKLAKGERFEAGVGAGQKILLEVVESSDAKVTVRMLHPLAGQKISMNIKVVSVRAATAAEQEAGRAISAPPPPPPPPKKK
jgi:FKBP-type peptidyl-prolyl cis-trans isomerase SlyD